MSRQEEAQIPTESSGLLPSTLQSTVQNSAVSAAGAAAAQGHSESQRRHRDEIKGYLFMAASALGFATNSACVKALAIAKFPSLEIVFARSVIQLGIGLFGCLYYRVNPLGPADCNIRKFLVLRGTMGALGLALFFYAVSVMPLSDATVVFFTGPVFSAIFAYLMLGEPYGTFDRIASFICMSGIILVVKPSVIFGGNVDNEANASIPDDNSAALRGKGTLAALLGAMSGAFAYCIVRKMGASINYMVHISYFGIISLIGSFIFMNLFQDPRMPNTTYEWTVMAMLGLFACLGQICLTRGLQLAPAGPGTLMRNLDVVFAFIFGITLFDEIPDWLSIAGSIIIIGCTVSMGVHKWFNRSH